MDKVPVYLTPIKHLNQQCMYQLVSVKVNAAPGTTNYLAPNSSRYWKQHDNQNSNTVFKYAFHAIGNRIIIRKVLLYPN